MGKTNLRQVYHWEEASLIHDYTAFGNQNQYMIQHAPDVKSA